MKRALLPLLLAAVVTLSACGAAGAGSAAAPSAAVPSSAAASAQPAEPQKITAEQAHARMQSGDELVILDVRTAEEYAQGHIPGAILIPNEEITTAPPAQLPVLDTEILIYCRSGNRSAQAAKKLAGMGYTNLYDFGGIKDWPYETETGAWTAPAKSGTLSSFTAYDLAGLPVDESVFSGHKLTMINIWATFCGPCLREMPELGQLAKTYADKGVQIIGIAVDVPQGSDGTFDAAQLATARELVAQTGADYLHLLPSADLVSAKLNTVSVVPDTLFVDAHGQIVGKEYEGSRDAAGWSAIIDSLLPEVGA
jgi:rhodanese-related sulfurtransferase/peroxiredoxin